MTSYTLWIVSPQGYSHSRCFEEVAQSLKSAFVELGHGCDIVTDPPEQPDNVIILGAHLLHPDDLLLLNNPIVWQLEQMPDKSDPNRINTPLTNVYLETLKRATVWDYCNSNIENLKRFGIEAKLLEVGYSKSITRVDNVPNPDIDVLFIGSMNERRSHILQQLHKAGLKVLHAFDCYGVKRDVLIARSKIVLNVHYYEAKIFEIVRCSYLMANRKCIVSETGKDLGLENDYASGIIFAPYDNLVERCVYFCKHELEREETALAGYNLFTQRKQVDFLRKVL